MRRKKLLTSLAAVAALTALLLALMPAFSAVADGDDDVIPDPAIATEAEGEGASTDDGDTTDEVVAPTETPSDEGATADEAVPAESEATADEVVPTDEEPALEEEPAAEAEPEEATAAEEPALEEQATPAIAGRAHVQATGTVDATPLNAPEGTVLTIGTTGQSKRLEAIWLRLSGAPSGSAIVYRTHIQSIGWQGWRSNNAMSGTSGRSLRLEAIQIKLSGPLAETHNVFYRAHVQGYGWLGWAHNGQSAGSAGVSRRVEAIQVVILPKSADSSKYSASRPYFVSATLSVSSHISNVGWMAGVGSGQTSGKTQYTARLEAFKITMNSSVGGSIMYRAHVQGIGWQGWSGDGDMTGTTGQSRRVEAIEIVLKGSANEYFDVYYRAHVEGYGWLGWAKNGESAGSTGCSLRLNAVQVRIVGKGSAAPGSTKDHLVHMEAVQLAMYRKAQGYYSPTSWLILVDVTHCRVGIFREASDGSWAFVKYWTCTCGRSNRPTCIGTYYIGSKGYMFGHSSGDTYSAYYYTQFNGDYLFHSVLYEWNTFDIKDGRLGMHLSAGCVRLQIDNAKWLQNNVPYNTKVVTYL